jgi:hypothetical protein
VSKKNGEFNYKDSVTLREYFESMAKEMSDANDEKFRMIEKASDLANENIRVRIDSLNEWRAQNKDERGMYMTKSEYEVRHDTIQKQVDDLRLRSAEMSGKASQSGLMIAYIFSIISTIIGVIGLFESLTH